VLRELRDAPDVDLKLIVTAAHLAAEFGQAADEIVADGFEIAERVECLLSSDSDVGMAKTIGVATLGLAEVLGRMRPDLMLLIADRYEMLAPASVALALRIPVAHIEGGDVSEGAIDDAVRNALTKMRHLHFAPTELARRRVLAMGEESWRVMRSGAPSLDHLRRSELPSREQLQGALEFNVATNALLVAYHPVTLANDTLEEVDALFAALEVSDRPVWFCFPNADAGSRELYRRARALCAARADARLFVNLNPLLYLGLLREASIMIGNSSSGIMESPSLALPCINVGRRQQGRERASNIIDVAADRVAIEEAIRRAGSDQFRHSLEGMTNPYGDGDAATRIVERLRSCPLGEELLIKKAFEL
jgi:UDP-N-acetylglucosamine 2-epimerase (non-hydrolysing)/GDP/UDP-N,N'-diacetylbacillosamine 2-epimerase (hydrolysing)